TALPPRLAQIRALLAAGDPKKAVAVARDLTTAAPREPLAVRTLADTLVAANMLPDAVVMLQRLVEMTGEAPDSVVRLSSAQALAGDVDAGRETLRKAISANPDNPTLRQALIDFALRTRTTDKALAFAGELAAKRPGSAAADL